MQKGKGLAIEWWPVAKPRPYEGNPRTISDQAIQKVAASIKSFGWRQPLVVDVSGTVVVGHTRLLAAQWLKLSEVPVHVAKDLRPEEARAYRLADNRVGEESRWDLGRLDLELTELAEIGFDLAPIGFEPVELSNIQLGQVAPGSDTDQGSLDTSKARECTCPACGHVFAA